MQEEIDDKKIKVFSKRSKNNATSFV